MKAKEGKAVEAKPAAEIKQPAVAVKQAPPELPQPTALAIRELQLQEKTYMTQMLQLQAQYQQIAGERDRVIARLNEAFKIAVDAANKEPGAAAFSLNPDSLKFVAAKA